MRKTTLLLIIIISMSSCSNQVVEKQVNKKGGEWVSSGTKFIMGSDEQVEIVKIFYLAMQQWMPMKYLRM